MKLVKVSELLRVLRNGAGKGQKELSEDMGKCQSVVSRDENENYIPSLKTLQEYARLYNTEIMLVVTKDSINAVQKI